MKPSLETLPVELVDHIQTLLDFQDILSFRLTSRTIESKASQHHLAKFFTHKHVELTPSQLEDMGQVTSQGRLGRLLQHCTIVGTVRSDMMKSQNVDKYVYLLGKAFSNLKQHSPKGSLASLCFRVDVCGPGATLGEDTSLWRRDIWATARRTFNLTMAALHASQLPIEEHLDLFGGFLRCSLAYDAFLSLTQQFTSMPVFSSLKKLTANLSSPFPDSQEDYPDSAIGASEHCSQAAHGKLTLQGLLTMSDIMPKLESLDIHWYNIIGRDISSTQLNSTFDLGHSNFACFKTCSLRGVYVFESDLLEFIKAIHPTKLTMTDIRLSSGTYSSIFEYITHPTITQYHLDDLRENGVGLVHFDVPGEPKYPYRSGSTLGPSTLTRQKNEVAEAIRYRIAQGRPLGSGERTRWLRSKMLEFGPPD